jgi:hypothetical protein
VKYFVIIVLWSQFLSYFKQITYDKLDFVGKARFGAREEMAENPDTNSE